MSKIEKLAKIAAALQPPIIGPLQLAASRKTDITRDDFENWLILFDDSLDAFLETLPAEVKESLDFSPESLDVLESWILNKYPNVESILIPDQMLNLDALARYIGETYRKVLGGIWNIILTDPRDAYFALPIIDTSVGVECPVTLATASTDRRTGHYLRTVLNHYWRAWNEKNKG